MSGIKTLEDIVARCYVNQETGCWEWGMACSRGNGGNLPVAWHPESGRVMSVPKLAMMLAGRRVESKWRAWRTCGNELCVNPAHCRAGTAAQWGRWTADSDKLKGDPKRSASIAARRRAESVITPAIAAEIRSCTKPLSVWANRLGISTSAVSRCRRQETYRATVMAASVWSLAA